MGVLYHLGVREKFEPQGCPAMADDAPNAGDGLAATQTARETTSGYSGLTEESGPFHSLLEHVSTYSFVLLFAAAIYFSIVGLAAQGRLWLIAPALALGMVAGDFVSGLVHWLADTYGSERTPIVGGSFIKWFRLHHVYPKDICTHGFINTNGNTCILVAPLVVLCLPFVWDEDVSATRSFSVLVVVLMAATTVATNQFHKWAHEDAPSLLARGLQKSRLILPPAHHSQHHAGPFDAHYCIANGWLNPLLDRVKFFGRLERALAKLGMKRDAGSE